MGEHHQWEIGPDDIILAKIDGTVVEGSAGQISREGSVHFSVYRNFKEIGAVIHAHPANCLVFACYGKEMPSVTAMAEHFRIGTVPLIDDAPPGSDELALNVIETFKRRLKENKALVVLMPAHGVVVAGKDINEAYVILESVETNARVFLMRRLLEIS
jgi:L-fuculose-phosphate aldolase